MIIGLFVETKSDYLTFWSPIKPSTDPLFKFNYKYILSAFLYCNHIADHHWNHVSIYQGEIPLSFLCKTFSKLNRRFNIWKSWSWTIPAFDINVLSPCSDCIKNHVFMQLSDASVQASDIRIWQWCLSFLRKGAFLMCSSTNHRRSNNFNNPFCIADPDKARYRPRPSSVFLLRRRHLRMRNKRKDPRQPFWALRYIVVSGDFRHWCAVCKFPFVLPENYRENCRAHFNAVCGTFTCSNLSNSLGSFYFLESLLT